MASTIKLKRSGTGGAIPSTTAISEGEVFINYYDGKLFFLKNQGGTKSIVTLSAASGGGATSLPDLSDVSISSPASGDLLKYNGTEWANAATIAASAVTGLSTVATSGAYADLTGKPSIPSAFDDLSDVTITSAASDQILKYNGSAWVNVSTIPSSAVSGLAAVATTGAYSDLSNKPSIPSSIDDLSDVTITSAANGNLLQYNGSAWVNVSTIASSSVTGLSTVATSGSYNDLTGTPTLVTNLDGLSDVAITSAAIGQFIVHDGTQFVNSNTITASGAAIKPLVLKGAASQSANLLEAQNSSGTAQFSVGSAGAGYFLGSVGIGKSPTAVKLEIDAGSGAAFKTNTTGAEAATFSTTNTFQAIRMETTQASCLHIINFQYSGTAKGYVGHAGATNRTFVGNDTILFNLFESGTYSGRAGLNTLTPGGKLQIDTGAAATKGLIVKGATSQSANLFELQDSSGNPVLQASPAGNLTVNNLTINGTTTTVNSVTVTIDDPIFTIGGDTAPTSDDNKDRGVEFRWHDGASAKIGFFGYDDSAAKFTCFADATNTAEVFAGNRADAIFKSIESTVTTGEPPLIVASTTNVSNLNADLLDGYHATAFLTPAGSMMAYAGATAPSGWLLCDGSAVSRTTYATLWDVLRNGTSSSPYGNGDGSTTFNLPDLRRRTVVGKGSTDSLGDSDGISAASRTLTHKHGTKAHYHGMGTGSTAAVDIAHNHDGTAVTGSITSGGAHTHAITARESSTASTAGSLMRASSTGTLNNVTTASDGTHTHAFSLTAGGQTLGATSKSLTGTVGLVTGGVDGNTQQDTTESNENYLIANWIIKT